MRTMDTLLLSSNFGSDIMTVRTIDTVWFFLFISTRFWFFSTISCSLLCTSWMRVDINNFCILDTQHKKHPELESTSKTSWMRVDIKNLLNKSQHNSLLNIRVIKNWFNKKLLNIKIHWPLHCTSLVYVETTRECKQTWKYISDENGIHCLDSSLLTLTLNSNLSDEPKVGWTLLHIGQVLVKPIKSWGQFYLQHIWQMINLSRIPHDHGQGRPSDLSDSSDGLVLHPSPIGRPILCHVLPRILSPEMFCLSQVSAMSSSYLAVSNKMWSRRISCAHKSDFFLLMGWKTKLLLHLALAGHLQGMIVTSFSGRPLTENMEVKHQL